MSWRDWTGVGERRWKTAPNEHVQPSKTLWDLLQLLIVPVILVGVTFLWSASQTKGDNEREDRRIEAENTREDRRIAADRLAAEKVRQNETLNDYIQQMSDLMLNETLSSSKRGDPVRSVARTVTLTALRRLDGERKGEVVRFLQEARLIGGKGESPVNLARADLTYAHLDDANLRGAHLARVILAGATLDHADLTGADLTGANLNFAVLTSAYLTGADLTDADLRGADLRVADLTGANLEGANLIRANLEGAKGLPKRAR